MAAVATERQRKLMFKPTLGAAAAAVAVGLMIVPGLCIRSFMRAGAVADVLKKSDLSAANDLVKLPAAVPENHPPVVNSIGMSFKLLPAGRFQMGSNSGDADENPVHEVTLTVPFYIGICEVTQDQYRRVMGSNPSSFRGQAKNPVENVSWESAVEFCVRLSSMPAEKSAGRVYRLPSEAEWEYACRAGTTTEYSYGADTSQLGDHAWFKDNSNRSTHPVGQKQPNGWGLCDMHGNVWEWCRDWKSDYPGGPVTNPKGPPSGSTRVYRGGSWRSKPRSCRSADRFKHIRPPGYRDNRLGFRVVLDAPLN